MVEITPSKVFTIQGIISFILLDFGKNALQQVDNKPNEKATTKENFPIEFVLCHGRFRFGTHCRDASHASANNVFTMNY